MLLLISAQRDGGKRNGSGTLFDLLQQPHRQPKNACRRHPRGVLPEGAGTRPQSVDESNTIVGTYMCQGKMPQAVKERYLRMKQMPEHPENLDALIRSFDCALSHPDAEDLEALKNTVRN